MPGMLPAVGLPLVHVDAFTDTPFAGNPAAVCLLQAPRDDGWLQAVGAEMNLPETAFVRPLAGGAGMNPPETAFVRPLGDGFELRWFTPSVEVDLCGHATLAAAHVLWETGRLAEGDAARFHTRSGLLTAVRQPGEGGWIELDFPATPAGPAAAPPEL